MIASLKPYPAMKESGVPWLGNVPQHWEVRRRVECGTPAAYMECISRKDLDFTSRSDMTIVSS